MTHLYHEGAPYSRVELREMLRYPQPVIRVTMMPRDTNAHGTIFGGVLLSYIDQAGAIEAARQVCQKIVTVAINEVVFHQPVNVGDVVSFITSVKRIGRTSITVAVEVFSTRMMGTNIEEVKVTEAQLTFVAIDDNGQPTPIQKKTRESKTSP